MKKIILLIIILSLIVYLGYKIFNPEHTGDNYFNLNQLKKENLKDKNIYFFMTTWCGASKQILEETYSRLIHDTAFNQVNVFIICGNNDVEGVEQIKKKYNIEIKIIPKSSDFRLLDRMNIKDFIRNNFTNHEPLKMNNKMQFGIPVIFMTNKESKIIKHDITQEYTTLCNLINEKTF